MGNDGEIHRKRTQLGLGKVSPPPSSTPSPSPSASPIHVPSPSGEEGIAYRPTMPATRVRAGEIAAALAPPAPASDADAPADVPAPSEPAVDEPPASSKTAGTSTSDAKERSSRRPRANREALRVDEVGQTAVDAAVRASKSAVFKLLRARNELATAPINHREGFLLAHVDGATSVQGLIDVSGMPEWEVFDILERLKRLGIVGLSAS